MIRKLDLNVNPHEYRELNDNHHFSLPNNFGKYFNSEFNILWVWGILSQKLEYARQQIEIIKRYVKPEDKIIFDVSTEAFWPKFYYEYYKPAFKNESVFLHAGLDYNSNDTWYHPGFFITDCSEYKPFKDRTYKYSSLARLIGGRSARIIFTHELYRLGILDEGLVSCASGAPQHEIDFIKNSTPTMSKVFLDKLPLLIDGSVVGSEEQKRVSQSNHKGNPGYDAVINVVLESSMNHQTSNLHPSLSYFGGWDSNFFTEKTAKAFNCMQLPLFIAPYQYVNKLRELGFDLFDDIIDHSYDNIKSNDARICMVAMQLKELISKEKFESIVSNYTSLEKRLQSNRDNIARVREVYYKEFFDRLENFIIKSRRPVI